MNRKALALAVVVELVGITIISSGIGFELATGQAFGYVLISGGSVIVAIGGIIFAKFLRRS